MIVKNDKETVKQVLKIITGICGIFPIVNSVSLYLHLQFVEQVLHFSNRHL